MRLLKPGWMNEKNPQKARRAIEGVDDQRTLLKAARQAPSVDVRAAAVKKLTDQEQLASFASDGSWKVRAAALSRIDDAALVLAAALGDPEEDVRLAAVMRITDTLDLERIVLSSSPDKVKELAFRRIFDPEVLERLPRERWDAKVIAEAQRQKEHLQELEDMFARGNLEDLENVIADRAASDSLKSRAWKKLDSAIGQMDDTDRLIELFEQYVSASRYWEESDPRHGIRTKIEQRIDQVLSPASADCYIESKMQVLQHNEYSPTILFMVGKASENTLADLAAYTCAGNVWKAIIPRIHDDTIFVDKIEGWYDISFFNEYIKDRRLDAAVWAKLSAREDFGYKLDADVAIKAIAGSRNVDLVLESLVNTEDDRFAIKLLGKIGEETLSSVVERSDYVLDAIGPDPRKGEIVKALISLLPTRRLQQIKEGRRIPRIRVAAAERLHLSHGKFDWIASGTCKSFCAICGIGRWDHEYRITDSQGHDDSQDDRISFTEFTCCKCGEKVRIDWRGGKKNEGYFLEA